MRSHYLGKISLSEALQYQERSLASQGEILGFEPSASVITLGVRGSRLLDLTSEAPSAVEILQVSRGGQATLHNPGQLVIFPVWPISQWGVRNWLGVLRRCSERLAENCGQRLYWNDVQPGLYDADGAKVAAFGIRVCRGFSTHGIAINVSNDLSQFRWIRPCGQSEGRVAQLKTSLPIPELFNLWVRCFAAEAGVDNAGDLADFSVSF